MLKKISYLTIILVVLTISLVAASKYIVFNQTREVAITIDDLPLMGFDVNNFDASTSNRYFESIVNSLVKHNAPAIGFVIADRMTLDFLTQLKLFQKNGFLIGNHTYSHPNLRYFSAEQYIKDIAQADQILTPIISTPKYFRYPYLAEGWWWTKKAVHDYLIKNNYIIAPVTIDSRDFVFNVEFYKLSFNPKHPDFIQLKKRYLDFIWNQTLKVERKDKWFSWLYESKKQILLIHANQLNSYCLDSILTLYENHGYHFISIDEALKTRD